jgi:hypothetical protein
MATFSLRVPKWFAPGDKQNFYVLATDDFVAPFRRGDLIVIDGSEKNPSELLESFVVAYRPNHFSDRERDKIERRLAEGLSSEEVKRRRDRRQFPFLRTGLFVGRLIRGENIGGTPAIEFRTANGNTLLEYLPGFLPASRKDKAIYTQYAELQILGRYVGWFSAPARGFPYVGKEKK